MGNFVFEEMKKQIGTKAVSSATLPISRPARIQQPTPSKSPARGGGCTIYRSREGGAVLPGPDCRTLATLPPKSCPSAHTRPPAALLAGRMDGAKSQTVLRHASPENECNKQVLHGWLAPENKKRSHPAVVSKTSRFPCNRLQHRKCETMRETGVLSVSGKVRLSPLFTRHQSVFWV